jgi:N-acyl-D-aspartate/D-glutamate deacylase
LQLDCAAALQAEGVPIYAQVSPRTIDFNINWDQTLVFTTQPRGWNQVILAEGEEKTRRLLEDGEWRRVAREEWDSIEVSLFPVKHPENIRFNAVSAPELEVWLGKSLRDLVEARGGHPSDVLADWVLENDLRPGVVAVGIANSDADRVAELLTHPATIVSSSDAGAHVQMMCAAGDTTLLLTRHVRERGDLTLERAIHELTGRQAEIFGFGRRGRVAPGWAADLTVFALDELDWALDGFVTDLPAQAARLRRPAGGYRYTIASGEITQEGGKLTGARPARMLDAGALKGR